MLRFFGAAFSGGSVTVRVNGLTAPVFAANSTQINFQVPWELAAQNSASIAVSIGANTTPAVIVPLAPVAPGIFIVNAQGQGAVTIAATGEAVGSARPGLRGEYVTIYCTGLGPVSTPQATGVPSGATPLANLSDVTTVTIGGIPVAGGDVQFSGLAPGYIGLYQVNVRIPPETPTGVNIPLAVSVGGAASNTAFMPVQ